MNTKDTKSNVIQFVSKAKLEENKLKAEVVKRAIERAKSIDW